MPLTKEQIEKQRQEAEELLFEGPQSLGFAKGLFFGHFNASLVFPYPQLPDAEKQVVDKAVAEVRQFANEHIDAAAIDRNADIPQSVIDGLANLGVMGMTAPESYGGRDFSQQGYCRIMEVIGGHCSSTAVFVNAHHSIGIRALLLFGTEEQRNQWLPDLISARKLAAFALTEPQAGSDASNVQTMAIPTSDGKGYVLNGEKRYITNGGIAQVLTVMARTPVEGSEETKVTAFLVTPDMDGFEVVEERMPKVGIRGTATARLAFRDMFVPKENILGPLGKGLRVALTVLDFGRTTFGASCTGVAKACVEASAKYAKERMQFKQKLAEFELVKKKIAFMAAHAFAMEATTQQCAAFIDSGSDDYMLETAMLKVWSTDALWKIVNDTLQIYGGKGYFTDQPYERWMRDARINMIGEGANEVLKSFIAMVGIKPVADQLLGVKQAWENKSIGKLLGFFGKQIKERMITPSVPVKNYPLKSQAKQLGRSIRDFRKALLAQLFKHREDILFRQYVQERLSDVACELYASACTISRVDHLMTLAGTNGTADIHRDIQVGRYYLQHSEHRIRQSLAALKENEDEETTRTADAILERF